MSDHSNSIAIVGMSGRFPGAKNLDEFWKNQLEGKTAVSFFDEKTLRAGGVDSELLNNPNYVKAGYILDDVDQFDAEFFNINPREAAFMDPQQRLFMECAWQALESSGYAGDREALSVGVFGGASMSGYFVSNLIGGRGKRSLTKELQVLLGNDKDYLCSNVSYKLDLRGPSVGVQTACSTSLVAVSYACDALLNYQCDLALAGGVTVRVPHVAGYIYDQGSIFSPDGYCRSFDDAAGGTVFGSGVGVVALKRYDDAVNDGDEILAVIKGSAVNNDGAVKIGFTAPGARGQAEVIAMAQAVADVDPGSIQYIEAHGTGTHLGDPVEVAALTDVFSDAEMDGRHCAIGSVKSSVGHLEAAAGIAGLIRTVLALRNRTLPPSLHYQKANRQIDFESGPFYVNTEAKAWHTDGGPRRAGVSSFGIGGTNAHVVLEEGPEPAAVESLRVAEEALLVLSAKNEAALQAQAQRYADDLAAREAHELGDVCYSAATGRSHFDHRLSVIAGNTEELVTRLRAVAQGQLPDGVSRGLADADGELAFVFTGQGSQYAGMGRELYEKEAVFRSVVDRCDACLADLLPRSLREVMFEETGLLDETQYTQPALYALEAGLAALWQSWGIRPTRVLGHSVGEYVAAHVAGVFDLETGLRLLAARARLMQALPAGGEMVAARLSAQEAEALLAGESRVSLAALNGPKSVVLSGDAKDLARLCAALSERGVGYQRLTVSHAFHSPLMEPMLEAFAAQAEAMSYRAPVLPLVSNVSGELAGAEVAEAAYWVKHVRAPVRFATGVASLLAASVTRCVEIGPKPILLGMLRDCVPAEALRGVASLRPGESDRMVMLTALGQLYADGASVDWRSLYADADCRRISLPTYPFQRKRYWVDESDALKTTSMSSRSTGSQHPLLGRQISLAASRHLHFEAQIDVDNPAYLNDHRVFGQVMFPAACFVETALTALKYAGTEPRQLSDLHLHQPLVVAEEQSYCLQTVLSPSDTGDYQLEIFSQTLDESQANSEWTLHVSGRFESLQSVERNDPGTFADIRERCKVSVPVADYYQGFVDREIDYGPSFRAVEALWRGEDEALGRVRLCEALLLEKDQYQIHPALLDACLQVFGAALGEDGTNQTFLPLSIECIQIHAAAGFELWSYARLRAARPGDRLMRTDLCLFSSTGEPVATLQGFVLARTDRNAVADLSLSTLRRWLYRVEWQPQTARSRHQAPDFLSSPDVLEQPLTNKFEELSATHGLQTYLPAYARLESIATTFVLNALTALCPEFRENYIFDTDALSQRLGVVASQQRQFQRLLSMLEEDNILRAVDTGWRVTTLPEVVDPVLQIDEMLRDFPALDAQLKLLRDCGMQIGQMLRGEVDPVQVIFPANNTENATRFYQDSPAARIMNGLINQAVSAAIADRPAGRSLRVLEIGAGTGGTTASLLPLLPPDRTEYVYSDVSPLFLSKAKQRFKHFEFIQYQTLNIEQPPEQQGLQPADFDLVIAANVLHATNDMQNTMEHVQRLLAPGGELFMLEGTAALRSVDLIFGWTDGWWRFTDTELRPAHPLLNATQWEALLQKTGFARQTCIPPIAQQSGGMSQQSLIIAQAGDNKALEDRDIPCWLVFEDSAGVAAQLADLLDQKGGCCIRVTSGSGFRQVDSRSFQLPEDGPDEIAQLLSALRLQWSTVTGVIDLRALDVAHQAQAMQGAELVEQSRRGWGGALDLAAALGRWEGSAPPRLWLVTRGAQPGGELKAVSELLQAPLLGMAKVIALEHPELRCTRLDLGTTAVDNDAEGLANEILADGEEDQVAWRDGIRHVARLLPYHEGADSPEADRLSIPSDAPHRIETSTRGTLEDMQVGTSERGVPGAGEVEILVRSTGLNFRDVLNALGMYPGDPGPLGCECAGEVLAVGEGVSEFRPGDRVVAIASGSFSSHLTVPCAYVAALPERLSYEAGATIPVVFMTAYYTLHHLAQIGKGDKVLIHAATGGVGQAAIQIARLAGAEVYATASTGKWDVLASLGVEHRMNSRSLEFADQILASTAGEGVDIVLNSLAGEVIEKNLCALKPDGKFIEIGKRDIWTPEQIAEKRPDLAYFTVDLFDICQRQSKLANSLLTSLMQRFERGELRPIARKLFPIENVVSAFRYMQQSRHTGKVVITQTGRDEEFSLRKDASYLISGGLGGLGRLLARWMAERGAGRVILVGRSEADDDVKAELNELESLGTEIVIEYADVSDADRLQALITSVRNKGYPLRGVIHAAGVLDDGVLAQQDRSRFTKVLTPKMAGAWNLHQCTLKDELDLFVLFSSTASLLGSPGQSNHSAANAFLDSLAEHRRGLGLSGLSINWGAWAHVGAAAHNDVDNPFLNGVGAIEPAQGLRLLEYLLDQESPQVGVLPIDWKRLGSHRFESPFLSALLHKREGTGEAAGGFLKKLQAAARDERMELLTVFVKAQLMDVLGLDEAIQVDRQQGLFDLGLDSLTAVEFRNRIQHGLDFSLSATLAFNYSSIDAIADHLRDELVDIEFADEGTYAGAEPDDTQADEELDGLSESDLSRLLEEELNQINTGPLQ